MSHAKGAIPKAWRVFRRTALWGLGLVVALIAIVVAINAFDENLSPEVKRLLQAPQNPLRDEENLYLALMGFYALPGESPIAVGKARVAADDLRATALAKDPQEAVAILQKKDDNPKLAMVGNIDFCQPLGKSCWTAVQDHQEEIGRSLKANAVLYRRYLELHRCRGYYETETPSYSMFTPFPPLDVHRLFLANTALRIKTAKSTQEKADALADLYNDVATWRRMLTGVGPVVSRLLAAASLHGDLLLLGDLIADPNVDIEALDHEVEAVLALVEDDDWKLSGVFAYEFRVAASLTDQTRKWMAASPPLPAPDTAPWWAVFAGRLENYFYKLNATDNLRARQMLELQRLADSGAGEFLAERDAYRHWVTTNFDGGLKYAYNPAGRHLIAQFADAYTVYPLRAYDIQALLRLVRLGYEIRRQKLSAVEVAPFMRAHPQWSTHPVDGQTFAWDATERAMAMQPLGRSRGDRRFGIPVWTAVVP